MGSLKLSDGKHELQKRSSRSEKFVKRLAWVLRAGDLYLQAIEGQTIQWTANPAEAMSWLDADLAMSRLQLIPALSKVLVSSTLDQMQFKAQVGIHPLEWKHEREDPAVSAQ